jgi:16S rRNA (uracil1498-N3)-methyltransferase
MATAGDRRGAGPERALCRPLPDAGVVRLDRDEAHHLVRVRRVGPGDEVVLFDGEGGTCLGRLVRADAGGADVEVVGPYADRTPARPVVVAVAWPAGAEADELVATLAEMGVAAVVPLRTAREPSDPADRIARRADRHQRLAREAAKVSGSSRLLAIHPSQTLDALFAGRGAREGAQTVLLDPDPEAAPLGEVLADGPVLLVVGPPGGFTDEERAAAERAGARTASLGACALRTVTAAVAASAIALATRPPRRG